MVTKQAGKVALKHGVARNPGNASLMKDRIPKTPRQQQLAAVSAVCTLLEASPRRDEVLAMLFQPPRHTRPDYAQRTHESAVAYDRAIRNAGTAS